MLGTKLVIATSACIIQLLAPGTSWPTPTAPIRLGLWSSENACQPGVALSRNDSLPSLTVSPVGFSPADTLGVQLVAFWAVLPGCVGLLVVSDGVDGPAEGDFFPFPPRVNTRIATSAMTPTTAIPATINHGVLELRPPGGGPGG